MRRVIVSIATVIICILLAPILIMNLTLTVKSYINPEKVPDFFGIKPFVVLTWSMEPAISGGDLAITRNVDPAELQVGDIVSYREGDTVITHRVIELTENDNGEPVLITRGDSNKSTDAKPITYDQVESVYLFKINGLGNLAMFMQTPMGILIFVGIPLCAFIVYDILRRKFDERRDKTENDDAQAEIERLKAELAKRTNELEYTSTQNEPELALVDPRI